MKKLKLSNDCGKRIREARKLCGMTQKQVANSLNITSRSIIDYESGRINPGYEVLNKMSYLFKTSLSDLGLDLTYAQYKGIDIFRTPTAVLNQIPLYTMEDLFEIEIKHNRVLFPKLKPCNINIKCPDICLFAVQLENSEMELVVKDSFFNSKVISFPKGSIVTFNRYFKHKESDQCYLVKLKNNKIVFRKLYFLDGKTLFVALNGIYGENTYYDNEYSIIGVAIQMEYNINEEIL